MGCTDPAPEPNQLALRLCTFGPTMRDSSTQIPRKARFWADLGGFCEVSCPIYAILGALPRYSCTETLRYRYQAIHLTVCVQYQYHDSRPVPPQSMPSRVWINRQGIIDRQ
jgi:hypothetical protein